MSIDIFNITNAFRILRSGLYFFEREFNSRRTCATCIFFQAFPLCRCCVLCCGSMRVCLLPVLAPLFVASFPFFCLIFLIYFFPSVSVSNISAYVFDTLHCSVFPASCCSVVLVPLRYWTTSHRYAFFVSEQYSWVCCPTPLSVLPVRRPLQILSVWPFRDPFWWLWSVNKVSQSYVGQV